MEFNIIKNTFGSANSDMSILKVTNSEYDVTFYYCGDYQTEKNNGQIQADYLTVLTKPKHKNITIKHLNGELYIDLNHEHGWLYSDAEILALQKHLEIAREARTALLLYTEKILNGEEI